LNGMIGTLLQWDADEERWKVRMADGSGKLLKASNLVLSASSYASRATQFAPGQKVRLVGLAERPELEGQIGVVLGRDENDGRWKLRMQDGSSKCLRAENLQVV